MILIIIPGRDSAHLGWGAGGIEAAKRLPTAHIACKTAMAGKSGCVGGSESHDWNVGAWKRRFAKGWNAKNDSTLAWGISENSGMHRYSAKLTDASKARDRVD